MLNPTLNHISIWAISFLGIGPGAPMSYHQVIISFYSSILINIVFIAYVIFLMIKNHQYEEGYIF
jgi:large-conductance mechanosensitive channel